MAIKRQWKRAHYHYFKYDVAQVLGITPQALNQYCNRHRLSIDGLTLKELIDFINNYPKK